MLVLTRKVGESIVIDGGIKITIVNAKGKNIRVGIQAPDSVRVNREEIAGENDDIGNRVREPVYRINPQKIERIGA